MSRITRQQLFMEIAHSAAKRSTCFRGNVGAVVVIRNNVVSIGYNGPAPGEDHCTGGECGQTGCVRSIHAEVNAVRRCFPVDPRGADVYCTHAPCENCASELIGAGIDRVFYCHPYRLTGGLSRLLAAGKDVYRITPNGDIIEELTGRLIGDTIE
jgi:dCMP deaminase